MFHVNPISLCLFWETFAHETMADLWPRDFAVVWNWTRTTHIYMLLYIGLLQICGHTSERMCSRFYVRRTHYACIHGSPIVLVVNCANLCSSPTPTNGVFALVQLDVHTLQLHTAIRDGFTQKPLPINFNIGENCRWVKCMENISVAVKMSLPFPAQIRTCPWMAGDWWFHLFAYCIKFSSCFEINALNCLKFIRIRSFS